MHVHCIAAPNLLISKPAGLQDFPPPVREWWCSNIPPPVNLPSNGACIHLPHLHLIASLLGELYHLYQLLGCHFCNTPFSLNLLKEFLPEHGEDPVSHTTRIPLESAPGIVAKLQQLRLGANVAIRAELFELSYPSYPSRYPS